MSMNDIGWHFGPAGDIRGWVDDYLLPLTEAGIPVFLKSADYAGPLYEAQQAAAESGVLHRLVWRRSGQGYDLPNYNLSPEAAAADHWQRHLDAWPPELDPARVWLETINEPDKARSEWLADFAHETALLALQDGFRWAAFGWSTGEPEVSDWESQAMLDFLSLAALHPDRLAVALHEYSLHDDIQHGFPYLVGRYGFLFEICDEYNLARPTTMITEWGWHYDDAPDEAAALQAMEWAALHYGQHRQILGAATWYSGGGYQGIAHKVHPLIRLYAQRILESPMPDPPPPPPDPPPPDPPPDDCRGKPRVQYRRVYNVIPAGATEEEAAAIFRDGWRRGRESAGGSYDDAGIGDLNDRLARLHGIPADERDGLAAWYAQHYPGVAVEFAGSPEPDPDPTPPPPGPPGSVLFGLHSAADGVYRPDEAAMFETARVDLVKVMSSNDPNLVAALTQPARVKQVVIRIFQEMGGRTVTPTEFVQWNLPDVIRTIGACHNKPIVLEIHNEPNLTAEGLGSSWDSPEEFADWFVAVAGQLRAHLPGLPLMYPGLSPGGDEPGIRHGHVDWLNRSQAALALADEIGAHIYWAHDYPMATALAVLDDYLARTPDKRLWITEASNNKRTTMPVDKAVEYVDFWNACRLRARVGGVAYFVASAHPGSGWHWGEGGSGEEWLGTVIGEVVGQRE